jgi:hypothetical protein
MDATASPGFAADGEASGGSAAAASPGFAADGETSPKKSRRQSFKKGDQQRASVWSDDIMQCGYLQKQSQGALKRFQKRYFEASGHYLRYYESEKKQELKGALDMSDCIHVKQKGCSIKIDMGEMQVKLKADTDHEAETWVDNLNSLAQAGLSDDGDPLSPGDSDSDSDDGGGGKKKKKKKKGDGGKGKKEYPPDAAGAIWVSVSIHSGKDLVAKDFGGSSDPYVRCLTADPTNPKDKGTEFGRTATKMKTLNPDFGVEIGSFVTRGCDLIVAVMDFDLTGGHDAMGQLRFSWDELASKRHLEWLPLVPSGKEKVSGQLQIAVNVAVKTEAEVSVLGDTVDRDLPHSLLGTMHRTCFHANANAHSPHCYPYDRVAHHVARGAANLEQIVCEGQKFATKQEVCEFCWHLFFKAVEKGQAFVSGSWLVEDPGHRIFDAMSPLMYSRKFGKPTPPSNLATAFKPDYSTKTFGSTHYIEYLVQVSKHGLWRVPNHNVAYDLERGARGYGYYQLGIDIDTTSAHNDGSIEMGLFCSKAHIVAGKIPPKVHGGEWLFVKAEHFGTQQMADTVMHGAQLGKSLAGVSKGPKHLRGPKRTENPDKKHVKEFIKICELVAGLKSKLLDSELTEDEHAERAKTVGLSHMYSVAVQLQGAAAAKVATTSDGDTAEKMKYTAVVHRLNAFVQRIDSDPGLDHKESRTGLEVILTMHELDIPVPPQHTPA